MFELSQETKNNISACLGIPFEEIYNWDYESDHSKGKEVKFSKSRDRRRPVRGNPLLSRGRIRTMEDVDKRLHHIANSNKQ